MKICNANSNSVYNLRIKVAIGISMGLSFGNQNLALS